MKFGEDGVGLWYSSLRSVCEFFFLFFFLAIALCLAFIKYIKHQRRDWYNLQNLDLSVVLLYFVHTLHGDLGHL